MTQENETCPLARNRIGTNIDRVAAFAQTALIGERARLARRISGNTACIETEAQVRSQRPEEGLRGDIPDRPQQEPGEGRSAHRELSPNKPVAQCGQPEHQDIQAKDEQQ